MDRPVFTFSANAMAATLLALSLMEPARPEIIEHGPRDPVDPETRKNAAPPSDPPVETRQMRRARERAEAKRTRP
jgi:hypothetical protein